MTRPNEYHWVLGHYDHIEFPNGGDPVPAPSTQLSTLEGLAAISDQTGALLMYTDGQSIWDGSLTPTSRITTPSLGGDPSSTQSAIIVPPAGIGGTDYHVFAVGTDDRAPADKVYHSTFRPASGTIAPILAPTPISDMISTSYDNTERLAATSHADCEKYWVILQDGQSANLHALLVDANAAPTTVVTSTSGLQQSGAWEGGYMKFSHDGKMLAYADFRSDHVVLLAFDTATGLFTDMHLIQDVPYCYGIEFSPDNQTLYVSSYRRDDVRAHSIASGPVSYPTLPLISAGVRIGALQLAPNGKIYGKASRASNLLEIGQPDTPLTPAVVPNATYADGTVITLTPNPASRPWRHGLPTFTRLSDACAVRDTDVCAALAEAIDTELDKQAETFENVLEPCDDSAASPFEPTVCTPLELPDVQPSYQIKWGASRCDGMESDDVETMSITICNPYSNVRLSNLVVHEMVVTLPDGTPVPALPDGAPSVTLVPRGPQCFGDLAPCSCTSREFVVRTRGAAEGKYAIKLNGVCFDVCLHQDTRACFIMEVCRD